MKYTILGALLLSASSILAKPGSIDINPTRKGPQINPNLYGIFLEEINHGVDGGLYAELVRNRGFEDSRPPEGYTRQNGQWHDAGGARAGIDRFGYTLGKVPFWMFIQPEGTKGSIHLEESGGVTEASAYCLRFEIRKTTRENGLRILNMGFFGIGIEAGKTYNLSLYAKGHMPMSIFLEDELGKVCSDILTVSPKSSQKWGQLTGTLTATRDVAKARLAIAPQRKGKVWLDFVSLFPSKTWKGQVIGLRPDLAQMIADLKPKFVRFPGGCNVDCGTIETSFNWKETVGPLEKRKEKFGPWMYRRTYGMGVYEYLQFCEDLEAEPLWVGFAGQTCIHRQPELVPMDEMDWVRDGFLDFVEYANGPADSKWGRMRAEAGHPEPFNLKYVEIGNENSGPEYGERYRFIYDALKAKYPNMLYLADLSFTSRESLGNAEFDIEDRHHYSTPQWFATGFNRYDHHDRNLPPLYLGEVAVTSGNSSPWRGNLLAALSEGIFLMGCERNADVVKMVSYAPLLGHVEGRTELVDAPPPWHAMIYFDNHRAFGTVSYHLWKLFGNNRPDYTVQTDVTPPDSGPFRITGSAGVGTWGTAAEYKNIRITKDGKTLYKSDFTNHADGWKPEQGQWQCVEGAYRQERIENAMAYIGNEDWSDYTLSLKARKLSGHEGFLIPFGRQGDDKYWWNLGGWGNTQHGLEMDQTLIGQGVPGKIETGRWYDIRIELKGSNIRCYLDDKLIHDVNATPQHKFFATAGYDEATGEVVLKAINLNGSPVPMKLNLGAGASVQPQMAEMTVLRGENLIINNALDDPDRVVPQTGSLEISGSSTPIEFPPFSFTVIRIKTEMAR